MERGIMSVENWKNLRLDRHSSVPLHQQLSDILVDIIRSGVLKPGDQLPSEHELMVVFDISRHVIRQTMNSMNHQGLIFTEHGRGSFVARERINKPLGVLQSYHESMRESGLDPEVKILKKELVIPPEDIAAHLNLDKGEEAFYLQRISYLGGVPVNFLEAYIVLRKQGCEKLMRFSGGSLYSFLEKECGIQLSYCQFSIEVVFAGEVESQQLNVPRGTVLVQLVSTTSGKNGAPVEHTRTLQPATMYRFHFDSHVNNEKNNEIVI
jgi:GntR family transcriptional regulator